MGRVYPHVCGATLDLKGLLRVFRGLSPRVWGNPMGLGSVMVWLGSIPTCVGQPTDGDDGLLVHWVYPHVCGATAGRESTVSADWGLSPRVWGNRKNACQYAVYRGSIPTCVGQPLTVLSGPHRHRVYPHVCGATLKPSTGRQQALGLSPRVWGNLEESMDGEG